MDVLVTRTQHTDLPLGSANQMPSVSSAGIPENTFSWARGCQCKDLILLHGQPYVQDLAVKVVMDFASGTNEEITLLCPHAQKYIFLDSHFLPPQRDRYQLVRQYVKEPLPFADSSIDLVTTNGSFDHFRQEDRHAAFAEIQRCLRAGGRLLFACEYHDFDPNSEQEFWRSLRADKDIKSRNCGGYANINLRDIVDQLTSLRPCQRDTSVLPDGKSLRETVSAVDAEYFTGSSRCGLTVTWGAFFIVFEKERLATRANH